MNDSRNMVVDQLQVRIFPDRLSLGAAAAAEAATYLTHAIANKGRAVACFAAAPSQSEFLSALVTDPSIDWQRVVAFQLDEYVGLPANAPQGFGNFLRAHLFDAVQPGILNLIGMTESLAGAEARSDEYADLLLDSPPDLVCLGIGENGHLAFNDPPVADFDDPKLVKVVLLDTDCRQQQVNDGCFDSIEQVPTHAVTLTIPALLSGERLICVVPGRAKQPAVRATLEGPISTSCPASTLRSKSNCTLYLDTDSYGE